MKKTVESVRISDIYVQPGLNCRDRFTNHSLKSLSLSIEREGLFIPIIVEPFLGSHKWRLIAGHRRLRAVKVHLGWEKIDAQVIRNLTESQVQSLNLLENFERSDLTFMEEAYRITDMYPDTSEKDLAKLLGRGRMWVRLRRVAVKFHPEIQSLITQGLISQDDMILLSERPDEEQLPTARRFANQKRQGKPPSIEKRRIGRRPRGRKQLRQMISVLATRYGVSNTSKIAAACLAWATNDLNDSELLSTLDEF